GNETTASTIGFALHFLAERPELVERLRLEIDEASPDGGPIEFETVAKLRGVRRTIDETLRLWPAAPGYFRKAR
ncbi:cytochrome P450, partial [Campylobacter jejuni]